MRDLGYAVLAVVASGEEAIREAAKTRPDLVVMDIRLRGSINGVEAAQTISRFGIPVIYLTALGDKKTVQRALEVSGAYGYASKPFDDTELQATIETALHRHQTERNSHQDQALATER
jgi:CheY-like chemotaxis protein